MDEEKQNKTIRFICIVVSQAVICMLIEKKSKEEIISITNQIWETIITNDKNASLQNIIDLIVNPDFAPILATVSLSQAAILMINGNNPKKDLLGLIDHIWNNLQSVSSEKLQTYLERNILLEFQERDG